MTSKLTGAEIRDMRVRAGLSQAQLADGIMSVSYLSLIESGRRLPRGNAIDLLTQRLNELGHITSSGKNRLMEAETAVRLALRLGHLEAARAELAKLQSIFANPDAYPPVVPFLAGLIELAEGDYEESARLEQFALEQMDEDHPQRVSAIIAYGKASLQLGILERATALAAETLQTLQSSGTVHERVHELHEVLSQLLSAKGDFAAAAAAAELNSAEEAAAFPRGRAAVLWAESRRALADGDEHRATEAIAKAAALLAAVDQPVVAARLKLTNARLSIRLGADIATVSSRLQSANDLLDASAHQRERAELTAFGTVLSAWRGNADLAEFESALANLTDSPEAAAELRVDLAEALISAGNLEPAAQQVDTAEGLLREVSSTDTKLWYRLGLAFEQVGRIEQAFAAMKIATSRLGSTIAANESSITR